LQRKRTQLRAKKKKKKKKKMKWRRRRRGKKKVMMTMTATTMGKRRRRRMTTTTTTRISRSRVAVPLAGNRARGQAAWPRVGDPCSTALRFPGGEVQEETRACAAGHQTLLP
jgi:hypothetical protein